MDDLSIRAGVPVFSRMILNPAAASAPDIFSSAAWYSPLSIMRPDDTFSVPRVTSPCKNVPVVNTIARAWYLSFIILRAISNLSTVSNAISRFLYSPRICVIASWYSCQFVRAVPGSRHHVMHSVYENESRRRPPRGP